MDRRSGRNIQDVDDDHRGNGRVDGFGPGFCWYRTEATTDKEDNCHQNGGRQKERSSSYTIDNHEGAEHTEDFNYIGDHLDKY